MGKRPAKVILGAVLTIVAAYFLVANKNSVMINASQRDSIQYWAAGKFLSQGENPYDAKQTLYLEQDQGYEANRPLVVRTPPWSLFLFLPLGFLSVFWGWVVWLLVLMACTVASVRLSWRMLGKTQETRSLCIVVGYAFAPVLACLLAAQMGLVMLLGIVLFLLWEQERPWAAGAALLLPLAKPHLLVCFWLTLLLWTVTRKKWKVAGGLAIAMLSATALALLLDHRAFQDYWDFLHNAAAIEGEFIPTVSGVLRLLFFRHSFGAQFVPTVLGLIWAVWYWAKNQEKWNWREHGLTVMVVSILTSPYGWLTDEVVLIPAILLAALAILAGKKKLGAGARVAVGIFALLNWVLLMFLMLHVPLTVGAYFWSSLLWSAWYFYGRWRASSEEELATRTLSVA